jgi:hypothetical protein
MVLVHVDTVMVLTTSKTTTTRMLSMLSYKGELMVNGVSLAVCIGVATILWNGM